MKPNPTPVRATFRPTTAQVPTKSPRKYPASTPQVAALLQAAAQTPKSREELQKAAGIKHREHFRKAYLEPLLAAGWVKMTIPDKPRSSKQTYRTTQLGFKILRERDPNYAS